MSSSSATVHRVRRIAAKVVRIGRRLAADLTQPTAVEQLMSSLPVVTSAGTLAEKVVVITGSTQGVGLAVARAFAKRGAIIVINGRRADAVAATLTTLQREGARVSGVVADVSDADGAARLIRDAVASSGRIDVLINNAAIAGAIAPAWKITAAEFDEALRNNLSGPVLCMQEAIRWFRANNRPGRVINVSTIATESTYPNFLCYSTTKTALEVAMRHFAGDLPQADVVVTALVLPSVQTERKFAADWASTELLPPVESVVPAFEHVATAPAGEVHGRVISAARFNESPRAEASLAGISATRKRILYDPLVIAGKPADRDPNKLVLLDRAENQFGTSPKAVEAIRQSLASHPPAFYPDERFSALSQALAAEHRLAPDCFSLGPGSWELISRIVGMFAKPGEEVVSNGPGWFGFNSVCQRNGVKQVLVPFDRGEAGNAASHNLRAVRKAITPRTRLVYLISPSNPEGVVLKNNEFREFLADIPPELPIMIDEAYVEYSSDPDCLDVAALVREGRHSIIGLRTFSKFYALAGLRVGYAFAQPELADLIRRQEHIFTISHVGAVAAIAALGDVEHRTRVRQSALEARRFMQRGLDSIGLKHIPSEAPFIFASATRDFETCTDRLAEKGIVIARYRFHGGEMVLLPVGTEAQNATILDVLGGGAA